MSLTEELTSDASYRLLVEGIVDVAIYMVDPTGTIASWNSGARRLKGYDPADVIGQHFSLFYTRADRANGVPERALERAARSGKFEGEGWRVRKDGSRFWANVVIDAVRDSAGGLIGFAKVTRDVTERSLREEQHRLIVDAAPNGMLIIDARGDVAFANAQALRIFGYERGELPGTHAGRLFDVQILEHALNVRDAVEHDGRAGLSHSNTQREMTGRRRDGSTIPLEVTVNVTPTASGAVILASVTDITERRAAEAERQRLTHALETERERQRAFERERRYEHERRWSTTFQRAVLPLALPRVPGCHFDAVYEPGLGDGQVGGDWYDAVRLIDGRVLVTIGDVTGSGLEAAVVVGVVRQIMRGISQLHASPMLILDAADRALCLEYPGVYVSAWVGVIDLLTRTLTYASAGHPPPLLISPGDNVRELGDTTTMLIGLREGHRGQSSTVALGPADTLVLYTDGVTEAEHDIIAGGMALRRAAVALARDPGPHPAETIKSAVIPNGSLDDVAILVVRTECVQAERFIDRWSLDPRDRDAAMTIRHELVAALAARGLSHDECANVEIVFGELIGNVVRHAGPAGSVDIAIDHGGAYSVLHVLDRGPGFSHVSRLPADPFAENGRGLFLIAALAIDFTVNERPDGGSHARVVLRGEHRPREVVTAGRHTRAAS